MTFVVQYALNNLGTIETCCQMQSASSHILFCVGWLSSETSIFRRIAEFNLHLLLICLRHETIEEKGWSGHSHIQLALMVSLHPTLKRVIHINGILIEG